ncbi:MAG TPA: protein-disulfide reductase DsbD domain-containing protein, partial [Rhizomicrobium sp.]|nr:protein-disulfide reductase DsbD domain-containing protein [Rhizomicrobium sp.]
MAQRAPNRYTGVMRILLALALLIAGLLPATAQVEPGPKVAARLIAERSIIAPGERVPVAFELAMKPGWHTYWVNPGDAGAATELNWQLPKGWQSSEIEWPYPGRLPVGPLMDYGYVGKVWLLTSVQAPASAKPGDVVTLNAKGSWLVCREVCIPEDGALSLRLTIAEHGVTNPVTAAQFSAARAKLPQASPWQTTYRAADNKILDLFVRSETLANARPKEADFFPLSQGLINGFTPQKLGFAENGIVLRTEPGKNFSWRKFRSTLPEIPGVLVLTSKDGSIQALSVRASPGDVPQASFPKITSSAGLGIALALVFAFIGGLILNLMPCVLPVLAMKAVAIASVAHAHPSRAARDGWAYGAGAILSFLLLGGAVIALRAGGEAIGWGFQLQEPVVVAGFALLMFAVGLNLSGVFELSSGLAAGETLARKSGATGAFFTGVLAVAVAAPCTAPFMAAALGYAVTQPVLLALLIFLALGAGFAAPFIAIGLFPALLRLIPKPGAWMLVFKQLLAFPMYAAAIWLVWVLALQTGANGVLAALAAMLLFALAAWAWSASRNAAQNVRTTARIGAAVVLCAALA